jgi:hypothetical protein
MMMIIDISQTRKSDNKLFGSNKLNSENLSGQP